ncbi:unnamed protein product, partial [Mesorhabditis spiculigera]
MYGVRSLLEAEDESDVETTQQYGRTRPSTLLKPSRFRSRAPPIIACLLILICLLLSWHVYTLTIRLAALNLLLNDLSLLPGRLLEVQSKLQSLRVEFDLSRDSMDDGPLSRATNLTGPSGRAVEYVMERMSVLSKRIDEEKRRAEMDEKTLSALGIRLSDMESLCWDSCTNGRRRSQKIAKSRVQKEAALDEEERQKEKARRIVFNRVPPN